MERAEFVAFGTQHIAVLVIIAAACAVSAWVSRNSADEERRWTAGTIGFVLLGYAIFFYVQQGLDGALSWQYSLPLELCNLVLIACIVSLFRPNGFLVEIAYFWGLGGVLQATITPDLALGFPSVDFFLFFWSHGATLAAIAFLAASRDFRPRGGSIVRMMLALNVYGIAVGAIDALAGWNYGYLCHKPAVPSLLDFLGPWPWYLISIEGVALLSFVILYLPWRIGESLRTSKAVVD